MILLLTGFTIIVRPSVVQDNAMQMMYQVQVVTKDKRLTQPPTGNFKLYRQSAEFPVRVLASVDRFGATQDGNGLHDPLKYDVVINWALRRTGCPPLGCPVLDPRQRHSEVFNRSVSLKSGEFLRK